MKPIIVLPKGELSKEDIAALRENLCCVVEAENPSCVKFIDSIPAMTSRTQMEEAAINLSRKLMAGELVGSEYRKNICEMYVDILVKGTPLDPRGTKQEQEVQHFDQAKRDELCRLAREEAKAERLAVKAAKTPSKSS